MVEETIIAVEESSTAVPGYLPDAEVRKRLALRGRQFRHDNMIRPLAPTPADSVTVTATSGAQRPIAYAELWYTTDGRLPDAVNAHKLPMSQTTVQWEVEAGYMAHWEATIPPQAAGTIVRYRMAGWPSQAAAGDPEVWAHDGHGFWFKVPDPEKGVSVFAYRVETWTEKQPAWLYDAVIYQIFLDRFHPGTADGRFAEGLDPVGKHGGTFKGVMAELPYLAELGINCLWLSPIGPAETHHRYDATDYFNVDPDLGSNEDLKGLIDQAHALGMRVILDFVPSHCSWRHPAFVAAQQDQNAPEADWFVFEEWPDNYRTFLNMVPWLVSFNTNSVGARQHLIESAVHWVQDYGFDGLRLDHTIGQGMDFWVAFRAALRAANPEVVTIGEATDTPDALRAYRGRLDDILDFPLAHGLRMTFGRGDWSLSQFDHYLQMHEHYLAEGPERVSFLDNHDMNRFLFVADQDIERLKMAAVVQFTLTPTPTIYYGTEIGMSHTVDIHQTFGGDSYAREDMIWDRAQWDEELLDFYRQLIALRHKQAAVRYGERVTLAVDDTAKTYAYAHHWQGETVLTALNLSAVTQVVPLPESGRYELLLSSGAKAVLTEDGVVVPAKTAVVVKLT